MKSSERNQAMKTLALSASALVSGSLHDKMKEMFDLQKEARRLGRYLARLDPRSEDPREISETKEEIADLNAEILRISKELDRGEF